MRDYPLGIYNQILHTHDHKSCFMTLWALVDKTTLSIANVMTLWYMAGYWMDIYQNDNSGEFKGAVRLLMQRMGVRIINSSPRHPQSQGMNE